MYQGILFLSREHAIQYHKLLAVGLNHRQIREWTHGRFKERLNQKHGKKLDPTVPGHFKAMANYIVDLTNRSKDRWNRIRLEVTRDIMLHAVFSNLDFLTEVLNPASTSFLHDVPDKFWGMGNNYHGKLLNHIREILTSVASHAKQAGQNRVLWAIHDSSPSGHPQSIKSTSSPWGGGVRFNPKQPNRPKCNQTIGGPFHLGCVNLMNHLAYKPNNHISNHNKIHLRNLFRRKFGKHSVRSISKLAHKGTPNPLASASDFPPLSPGPTKKPMHPTGLPKTYKNIQAITHPCSHYPRSHQHQPIPGSITGGGLRSPSTGPSQNLIQPHHNHTVYKHYKPTHPPKPQLLPQNVSQLLPHN